MASTLLGVDDSVTMRKVLEITFAGTDLKVVTANTSDAALQQLKAAKPDLVISDITLEGKNGYELCKAIKQQAPGTIVLLLSSKQAPFDAAKGADAHADDHIDKPFDTQQMIDKVRKMLTSKGDVAGAFAPAATAAPAAQPAQNPMGRTVPMPTPATSPPAAAVAAPTPPQGAQRAKTLIYSPATGVPAAGIPAGTGQTAAPPMAAKPPATTLAAAKPEPAMMQAAPAPTPATGVPLQQRTTTAQSPAAPAAAVSAHVNGQMAAKLEGLGLSAAQVDAVMALSREVVERVVWEVVPVLAETLIKEELARLTK